MIVSEMKNESWYDAWTSMPWEEEDIPSYSDEVDDPASKGSHCPVGRIDILSTSQHREHNWDSVRDSQADDTNGDEGSEC